MRLVLSTLSPKPGERMGTEVRFLTKTILSGGWGCYAEVLVGEARGYAAARVRSRKPI